MALTNLQGSDPLLRHLRKQLVTPVNTDSAPWTGSYSFHEAGEADQVLSPPWSRSCNAGP